MTMQALSKALTEDELLYLRLQFNLLEPDRDGCISLENFRMVSGSFEPSMTIFFVERWLMLDFIKMCRGSCEMQLMR